MSQPTVSVVIATYNNGDVLQGCLQSLAKQANPPARFEVIVVDNGSNDDTATVVGAWSASLPMRYCFYPKQASFETAPARNVGLKEARGEIIISLADDALAPPQFLRRHADLHQIQPSACLVGARHFLQRTLPLQTALAQLETGEIEAWAGERDPHRHLPQIEPSAWVRARAPWAMGNWDHLSLRREDLLAVGWFDEWYSMYEEPDYELCYRLFKAGLHFVFDPSLVVYHQYRYRYPRAYWRGRSFDYLHYKFKDPSAAVVRAAWRLQEGIDFRGDLCLSQAHHARLGALHAALSGESANHPPRVTIGLVDPNHQLGVSGETAYANGIETLVADEATAIFEFSKAETEWAAILAQARHERSRELLQALAATQTDDKPRQAQIKGVRKKARADLLWMSDGNGKTAVASEKLPSRPSFAQDEANSLVSQAIRWEVEQSSQTPEIGSISEGYSYPPRAVSFKLTSLCNLRCRMCGQYGLVGNALRQSPAELKKQMDLERLKWIIDQIVPFRPGMIYLWGGEPFLHPAFIDLVNYIKQQKLFCIVTTNGTRLETTAEALVNSRLDILRISLDGPPEVHDLIRGVPGVFGQIARGVQAINERKKAVSSLFPLLEVICTISQDNYRHLEAAASLFEGMGIDTITFVHQLYTPPAIGRRHQQLYAQLFDCEAQAWQGFAQDVSGIDVTALGQTIERLRQREGAVPIGFSPPLRGPEQVAAYYQDLTSLFHDKRCSGPWLWLEVYPDGNIYPCHEFPDYCVGNILQEGFWPVWNGPRFRQFRCQLMLHRGFPGCAACRSQQLVDAFVV